MKTFKYSALKDGEKFSGVIEAMDEYVAAERIKSEYPVILRLTPIKSKESILNKNITKVFDDKTLSIISSELATILNAGVDVGTCLEMIAGDMKNKNAKKMLLNTSKDVRDGNTLASSFEKNCEKMPTTFIESVRAGEMTGNLDETFETLERYYTRTYKVKEKIKQALIYPIFVIVISIIVLMVVMIKVIPVITDIFNSYDGELPRSTVILMSTSAFWAKWWALIALIILLLVIGIKFYSHTDKGRIVIAKIKLSSPLGGKIRNAKICADISITMEMLLKAGIPLTNALEITSKSIENFIFQREMLMFKDQVENGSRLGELMQRSKVIPEIFAQMICIGEETGELEKMLHKTGEFYSNEAENKIKKALAKLEPTILIFLGLFAGFIRNEKKTYKFDCKLIFIG